MGDRRDGVAPIGAVDPRALAISARERREAQSETTEDADAPDLAPARYDTYRMVIDPETLKAVTEVRDPETGEVRFTVPSRADDDAGDPGAA